MTNLNTPITTDDRGIKKVLGQKQPAVVVLYDGKQNHKPLDDALKQIAKKNAGELLVVRVDASENPKVYGQYDQPLLPAVVTLTKAFFGRNIKSSAESVRPSDIRKHVDHLLKDTPLPQPKAAPVKVGKSASHTTDRDFRKDVLKSKTPVLVDFWAPWCGPCVSVAPFVDKMAKQYAGKVKVIKLNTDENPQMSNRYQVRSIPTFIMFDNGQPIGRFSSANPRMIQQMLDEAVALKQG